jgi:ankyrin repeat protein
MVSFSGYSLLLYLSNDYLGGETSFFGQDDALQMSKRKLTPVADHELKYVARVRGQAGDILIFPHGSHAGCHPNPLHEGSTVTEGEKILMRTDIVFRPQPKNTRQRRRPATEDSAFPPQSTARSRQASDLDLQAAEACIRTALAHVCPRFIDVATGSVSRIADAKAAEFSCNAATRVYWAARRLGQAQASPQSPGASKDAPRASSPPLPRTVGESRVDTVVVVSDFGVARSFDRVGLAERVVAAIPQDDTSATFAFLNVADGVAGTIIMTSRARAAAKAEGGLAPCSLCGRFVSVDTMGVEWHMKTVHRITAHAEAYEAAAAAQRAIVQYRSREETVHGSDDFVRGGPPRKLQISDMTEAQASPAAAARLVREGRVRSLGSGLEACRCGDVDELRRVVEEEGWCAAESRDRHGSGALLWAAGGGHLACCRYLVESCKVSATDSQAGRRGYDGRSALHWAARNGHLDVVRWLVKVCGCNGDAQSTDGTTPFSLAVWQGHLDVCGFLVECGADAHRFNSYGCNAAMWAAQGPGGSVTVFEYLRRLDVDVDRINDNGQGCLHKAAQRGNREICNWLLKVAQIRSAHHFQPNLIEKSIPSELARFAGDDVLAKTLESWEQRLGTSSADL